MEKKNNDKDSEMILYGIVKQHCILWKESRHVTITQANFYEFLLEELILRLMGNVSVCEELMLQLQLSVGVTYVKVQW